MKSCSGRIWKLGDDVNTDQIIPGKHLDNYDSLHLASHALEGVRGDFSDGVRPGDFILAGRNFGCGSSREQAVTALKCAGVSAVVAKSFARIFYRNAINLGLTVVVSCEAHAVFNDGDTAVLDTVRGELRSEGGTGRAVVEKIPSRALDILEHGGLVPYLKSQVHRTRKG